MTPFQMYDAFRLQHFKKRKSNINHGHTKTFSFYHFNEVDYFNYIYLFSEHIDYSLLSEVLNLYLKDGRNKIKIIFPSSLRSALSHLIDHPKKIKQTATVCFETELNASQSITTGFLSPVSNWKDIKVFTKHYLQGFASKQTNYREVALNFNLLMESKQVDFFLVKKEQEILGLCGNFFSENLQILNVGIVLNGMRNTGLHKEMIKHRLVLGKNKGFNTVQTWAYNDSISHNNLLKMNFQNTNIYDECLSKPLAGIIKKISSL